jgi:hypothetical protein
MVALLSDAAGAGGEQVLAGDEVDGTAGIVDDRLGRKRELLSLLSDRAMIAGASGIQH